MPWGRNVETLCCWLLDVSFCSISVALITHCGELLIVLQKNVESWDNLFRVVFAAASYFIFHGLGGYSVEAFFEK